MRQVSMATRDELVAAVVERYRQSGRHEKTRILDEFVAVTGFHRKHAMRLLRGGSTGRRTRPRPERRLYDEAVREALIVIWEASDRICGKRLKALAPILVEARACRKVCQQAEKRAGWRGFQAGFPSEGPIPSRSFHGHFQTLRQAPSRRYSSCRTRAAARAR